MVVAAGRGIGAPSLSEENFRPTFKEYGPPRATLSSDLREQLFWFHLPLVSPLLNFFPQKQKCHLHKK